MAKIKVKSKNRDAEEPDADQVDSRRSKSAREKDVPGGEDADRMQMEGARKLKPKQVQEETPTSGGGEFEVLSGTHWNPDPETGDLKEYSKGDTIQCEEPLDEMFANKFRRLDGPTRRNRSYDKTFDKDDIMDPPLHKLEAMKAKAKKEKSEEVEETGDEEDDTPRSGRPIPRHPKAAKSRGMAAEEDEDEIEIEDEAKEDAEEEEEEAETEEEEAETEEEEEAEDEPPEEEEEEPEPVRKKKAKKRR